MSANWQLSIHITMYKKLTRSLGSHCTASYISDGSNFILIVFIIHWCQRNDHNWSYDLPNVADITSGTFYQADYSILTADFQICNMPRNIFISIANDFFPLTNGKATLKTKIKIQKITMMIVIVLVSFKDDRNSKFTMCFFRK